MPFAIVSKYIIYIFMSFIPPELLGKLFYEQPMQLIDFRQIKDEKNVNIFKRSFRLFSQKTGVVFTTKLAALLWTYRTRNARSAPWIATDDVQWFKRLYSPRMVAEIKEGKKRTNSDET